MKGQDFKTTRVTTTTDGGSKQQLLLEGNKTSCHQYRTGRLLSTEGNRQPWTVIIKQQLLEGNKTSCHQYRTGRLLSIEGNRQPWTVIIKGCGQPTPNNDNN